MAAVRSKNTKPELAVRKLVHSLGYRYRLHSAGLPGKPDLVFPARHKIIFVHGCFWHRHPGCRYATSPKTDAQFWQDKFDANVRRDRRAQRSLRQQGWSVATVWQCQIEDSARLAARLDRFLSK